MIWLIVSFLLHMILALVVGSITALICISLSKKKDEERYKRIVEILSNKGE